MLKIPSKRLIIISSHHAESLKKSLARFTEDSLILERESARQELINHGPTLVMIDCRDALEEGYAATELLGDVARRQNSAILVLVDEAQTRDLSGFLHRGATHFLKAPFTEQTLLEAATFAFRLIERLHQNHIHMIDSTALAHHDAITDLPTERYIRTRIDNRIASSGSQRPDIALVIVALSRFHRVNAHYGRGFADKFLRIIAQRLSSLAYNYFHPPHTKGRCTTARLGGAEFALFIEAPCSPEDMERLAQYTIDLFDRPFVVDGVLIHLACRAGVAMMDETTDTADALFRKAAKMLDDVRVQQPNSFAIFDPHTHSLSLDGMNLETDLRTALHTQALDIVFQPQVSLIKNQIIGLEALVRWVHPRLGLLPPDTFVAVAEEAEIMPQFGEFVLRRAIEYARDWDIPIAVNISPAQLRQPGFLKVVEESLNHSSFDPNRLTFEITETALIDDFETVAAMMERIQALGIHLAIDDFGTGHASYAYLKQLPFDYLKLDRLFIQSLAHDSRDRAMVRAIIDMARALFMPVIAEGVENEEQRQILLDEGCTAYQGYLCSEPLPPAEVPALLIRHTQ